MDYVLSYADLPKIHIAVALFIAVLIFMIYQGKIHERIAASVIMAWVFIVLSLTILSRTPYEGKHFDFTPFWERGYFSAENKLNIFLLMPVGLLLPLLHKKWYEVFLTGLFCTCSIEVLQYLTKTGWFDINDIMINEFGVIVGYIVGWVLWKIGQWIWRH